LHGNINKSLEYNYTAYYTIMPSEHVACELMTIYFIWSEVHN